MIDKTTSEIISRFGYDKMPESNEEAIARFMEAMLERYKCEVILRKYALDSSKKKR